MFSVLRNLLKGKSTFSCIAAFLYNLVIWSLKLSIKLMSTPKRKEISTSPIWVSGGTMGLFADSYGLKLVRIGLHLAKIEPVHKCVTFFFLKQTLKHLCFCEKKKKYRHRHNYKV